MTYDVTDGTGATVASNISGTSVAVTVPAGQATPTVKARLNQWVSSTQASASPPCHGYPSAPSGLTLNAGDAQLGVSWTAPAGNGGTVASSSVSGVPSDGALATATCTATAPATTCTLTGLTNGVTYTVSVTATSNIGTGPASTTVTGVPYPATVMSGSALKLWLDGADPTTLYAASSCSGAAATSTVGCWADKSTSANHAVQATGGIQPTLAAVAGRAVPSFDGSATYAALSPGLLPIGTTSSTTFVVGRLTDPTPTTSGWRTALSWGTSTAAGTRAYQKKTTSANATVAAQNSGSSTGGDWVTDVTGVLADAWTSTGYTGYFNTVAGALNSASTSTGTSQALLGAQLGGSEFWQGQVPEILVFTGALTGTDRRTVDEYLARKWAVTITPQAPTAVTATPGDTTAAVAWTAPTWNGGAAVTGSTVTAVPSDGALATRTCTATAPATSCTLTSLTNGATYTVTVTATNNAGTGPASTSTTVIPYPAGVMTSSAMRLWLDGADPAALYTDTGCTTGVSGSGQSVACWRDRSGQGNHLTQSTSGNRPGSTSVNSRWVPSFDGTDDWLSRSSTTIPTGTSSTTTFVAATNTTASPGSAGEQQLTWLSSTGSTGQARYLYKPASSAQLTTSAYGTADAAGGTLTASSPLVAVSDFSSGTSYGTRLNGRPRVGQSYGYSTSGTNFELSYSGLPWKGTVQEVLVLNATATEAEVRQIEEYLARKWSAVITPQAPTGVTATAADAQAAVSWTAPSWTGGASVSSYTVTATPSDAGFSTQTCSSASTSCTVTGLTNGITYTIAVTATNSAGTGPASTSTTVVPYPAGVLTSSAVKLWLDGADSATLYASSGCTGAAPTTAVGCWQDKSTSANHVTQPAGSLQPALTPVNGRNVPSFDGIDDYLAGDPSLIPTGTSSSTIAAAGAINPSVAMNGNALISWGGTTSGTQRRLTSWSATGVDAWTTPQAFATAWPASQAQGVAVGEFAAGTSVSVWGSGDPGATGTGSYTTGTHHLWVGTGGTSTPAGRWMGSSSEIVVVDTTLTATQRRAVEEYLARKWVAVITPQAPTFPAATAGNAQAAVSWSVPSWNGGSAVTGYTATASPGGATCTATSPATTCTVTGLTNGTAYTFTVTATNAAGTGPASAATSSVTPVGPPGAPTGVAATAADTTSAVSWTAPASNGGSAITSYTATGVPSDGSLPTRTCTAASSPCSLTSLTNGITYTVTVTATNGVGTGSASASATVIPYPSGVMTSASVKVWLDARDSSTLSAATDCSGSNASTGTGIGCWKTRATTGWNAISGTTKAVLTASAINGYQALRFTRTNPDRYAITNTGIGAVGSADRSFFAVATGRTTADNSTNNNGALAMWPGYHGGIHFGGYPNINLAASYGYRSDAAAGVGGSQTVSGAAVLSAVALTSGSTLSLDAAVNAQPAASSTISGTAWYSYPNTLRIGAMSDTIGSYTYPLDADIGELVILNASTTSTQRRQVEEYLARKWAVTITPQAPTIGTATAGNAQATVTWTAPTWNGGSSVTGYTVTASPGGATCTGGSAATSCTVTGLTNGTAYTFTVTATNGAGIGPASAASNSATPATVPGAPTGIAATAGDTTSSVSWTAPASNGGAAITSYTATASPTAGTGYASAATRTCTSAASPCTVTSLTNGLTYTVTVTATNVAGTGAASSSTTVIPYPSGVMTSSAMRLWLDGADGATVFQNNSCTTAVTSDGQDLACWTDKSGQGNDLTRGAPPGERPTSTTVLSRFVPLFDGSNDSIFRSSSTLPTGTAASTTFTVARSTAANPATDSERHLFVFDEVSTGAGRLMFKPSGSAAVATNAFNTTTVSDGTFASGVAQLAVSKFGSGSYAIQVAGRPAVSQSYAYTSTNSRAHLGGNSNNWLGTVHEVLVLNTNTSAIDVRTVEEYLARKWAVSITPQAPTVGTATVASSTSASVSWTAPTWNGGASVTGYTVTASPGGATCTGGAAATSCTVTGLTTGQAYTFTVTATNSVGVGPESAASNSVTPS